jgi:PAS domain S-box-containing protein
MSSRSIGLSVQRMMTRNSPLLSYGVALLSVALALAFSLLLGSFIQPTPLALFYVAVMVSAWYGGLKPGLVATVLSILAINYFIPPYNSLSIVNPGNLVRLGVFVIITLLINGLDQARRVALRQEQQLRLEAETAQRRTAHLLEHMTDAFVVFDRHWRYTYANPAALQLLQKSSEELIGKDVWEEVFPSEKGGFAYRQLHRALEEQVSVSWEEFGEPVQRWLEVRAYPSLEGIALYFQDISERKRAEASLRQSEEQLRLATEGANIGLWYWDLATDRLIWTDQAKAMFGLPVDTKMSMQVFLEAVHPDDRHLVQTVVSDLQVGQLHTEGEYRTLWADGTVRWILAKGNSTYDAEGNLISTRGVLIDITDRHRIEAERNQAEATLRESEERFRTLAATVPQLLWTATPDGSVDYLSDQWADYIGLPPERLYAWNWQQVVHPDDLPNTLHDWQHSLQSGEPLEIQHRFRYHTGEWRWQLVRGIPVKDETGRVTKWVGTCTDIHESELRKQDAQFLSDLSEAIRTIDHADDLMTTAIEMIGQYLQLKRCYFAQTDEANDRAWITSDYHDSLPSLVGEHPLSHYPAVVLELLKSGQLYISNDNKRDPRSVDCYATVYEPLAIRAHVAVPFFMDGRWAVNLIAATDEPRQWQEREINLLETAAERIWLAVEKLRSEVALRESEDRYRALTELSPQLVFMSRADGFITYVNQWGLDFTGRSLSELQGHGWMECIHPEYRNRFYEARMTSTSNVSDYGIEILFRHADGVYRWLYTRALPVTNDAGEIEYWIGVAIDITDRKQTEAEREQLLAREKAARESAESANRIKDEFLAVVSHELRSPLNPILGWSKLLRSRQLDEEKTDRALEVIERNAQMQAQLINDLLDVSRILRGKLSLDTQTVDLVITIQAAMETVRLAAEAKSIQINTQFEPDVGQVAGDAGRLQQVVWNLLTNAVKFTSTGGRVDIRLERTGSQAQITITDTGKGIPPDFLPYVFEQFRQESSATTRRFGGLGLGLAIVRYLVELHGGTVQADSQGEGMGATFTVKLPLMPHQPITQPDPKPSEFSLNLQGTRILVVDDDDSTREFLAFLLELHGANVTATATAGEALTTLTQFQPDVLLSDIGMPDVDGYMLMRQVRALPPKQGGNIPAIALTAYAGEIDYQQAMAAGFQRHITKPIEPEVLIQAIATLLGQT